MTAAGRKTNECFSTRVQLTFPLTMIYENTTTLALYLNERFLGISTRLNWVSILNK